MGDGLEMTGHLVVILGRETAQLLVRCPRAELFESVELCSEDGLEMLGHLVMTPVERLHSHC